MASLSDRVRSLINKGNNKMGTSYGNLTNVVDNLVGGYKEASWIDLEAYRIDSGNTFNVKQACLDYGVDYTSLTNDNFVAANYKPASGKYWSPKSIRQSGFVQMTSTQTKSYNSTTGILTWTINATDYYYLDDGTGDASTTNINGVKPYLLLTKKANNAGSYIDLGTGQSFNVVEACTAVGVDYTKLTADDFVCVAADSCWVVTPPGSASYWLLGCSTYKQYDQTTGDLEYYIKADANIQNGSSIIHRDLAVHAYLLLATKVQKAYDLGTGTSFDVTSICSQYGIDKTTLTADNFMVSTITSTGITLAKYISDNYAPSGTTSMVKNYTASTGVLSVYVRTSISWVHMDGSSKSASSTAPVHAYLIA